MAPSSDIEHFKVVLSNSTNIVAIVGAGLSAASGVPTWRDTGGVWTKYDPSVLANLDAFSTNPSLVWQHYHNMREIVLRAAPNPAHFALAMMCMQSFLRTVAPSATFTLVTQNIDGLSTRALDMTVEQCKDTSLQSQDNTRVSKIYEMHGRVLDTLCTLCGLREHNTASPLCPALATSDDDGSSKEVPIKDLPHCTRCGGLLRPGVVWFDELPHHSRETWAVVDAADLCLLIGTSSQVQPAAGFAYEVADHGGKVAVFNTKMEENNDERDFLFLGPCEEMLPRVLFGISSGD